jgi:hypothetical protein
LLLSVAEILEAEEGLVGVAKPVALSSELELVPVHQALGDVVDGVHHADRGLH